MPQVITEVTRTIHAPIGQVWGIVTYCPCGSPVSSPRRSKDTAQAPYVNPVREQMVVCDPVQHLLRFRVHNDDVSDVGEIYSNMVLEDIDGKTTKFRWFAEGEVLPGPVQQNMRGYVEAMYHRCADSIEAKLTARS